VPRFTIAAQVQAPAGGVAGEIERVAALVLPLDAPDDARQLDVSPLLAVVVFGGEIRVREPRLHILQLDAARIHALIGTGSRPLERDRHARVALDGHPPHLNVAKEHHPGRPPVLERVGKDVDVHERTPRLTGAEVPQLSIGVSEPERRLSGIHARAEQLELERGLEVTEWRRSGPFDAEPRLADAEERVAIGRELVLERRQLRGPDYVIPVGLDLVEVVAGIEHHEAVDVDARLRSALCGRPLHAGGREQRRRRRRVLKATHWCGPGWKSLPHSAVLEATMGAPQRRPRTKV
jgi:hypothetical protein